MWQILVLHLNVFCRKNVDTMVLKSLKEFIKKFEEDYNTVKDSEQNLVKLTNTMMDVVNQMVAANKEKKKAVEELYIAYKTQ